MHVGREWLIDASGCDPGALREVDVLKRVFDRAISELSLHPVREPIWHVFPGEGGITGVVLLSESHLACHTYPELGLATFNLYCCRERPQWPWEERLAEMLSAGQVTVHTVVRQVATEMMAKA